MSVLCYQFQEQSNWKMRSKYFCRFYKNLYRKEETKTVAIQRDSTIESNEISDAVESVVSVSIVHHEMFRIQNNTINLRTLKD